MSSHALRVAQFMDKAKQTIPDKPEVPDYATRLLRARLILEECVETINALGFEFAGTYSTPELVPTEEGPDLIEIADGCADISVVVMGTFFACGIRPEHVLLEVDESNLRKFGPGHSFREDGKLLKPADWIPPNIKAVLEAQGWEG